MSVNYGFTVRQGSSTFSVNGLSTAKEARDTAYSFAIRSGWTPPKWWQWWRWGDTPAPPDDFKYREPNPPRAQKD